jgi:ABC-type amino acid transport substrate-binding protein
MKALAVLLALSSYIFNSAYAESLVLPIGIYDTQVLPPALAAKITECPNPRRFNYDNNQVIAELVLLCSALKAGGLNPQLDFKNTPDYLRIITNASDGQTVMPGFVVWRQDINSELFYVSEPVLKKKEYTKGIYTSATRRALLQVRDAKALKHHSVAANPNSTHDAAEIKCLGLKPITGPFNPISMARMVAAERADFLLYPFFKTGDLKGALGDVKLTPLTGVKVAFNDSLHFIVSKKHPQGADVYAALQKGLAQLRADGTIHYVYEQIGFFNPRVKNWRELGCKTTQ